MFYYLLVVFCYFWKFSIALLDIVLEEYRGTALGKKAARAGVFFDTDVMRRSRMPAGISRRCKSAAGLIFSGIKMYSGECRFNIILVYYDRFVFVALSQHSLDKSDIVHV